MTDKIDNNRKMSVFSLGLFKYMPYWPLFIFFIALSIFAARFYLKSLTPMYEAVVTLLIKDEKPQGGDSRLLESLNIVPSDKSLQNEIEIIRSKALMKEVVVDLGLYVPIFEGTSVNNVSAYCTSPINIKLRDPNRVPQTGNIYFSYVQKTQMVFINEVGYHLNVWSSTPYGILYFYKNERYRGAVTKQLFFNFASPAWVANYYCTGLFVQPVNRNSSVVAIKVRDNVPERAEDILSALSKAYSRSSIADKNALSSNTLTFLQDRIRYVENDLDSLEKTIQLYKSQKGIIDLSSQGKIFLGNVSSNDQKIADINMELSVLDEVEKYVRSKEGTTGIVPSTFGVNEPLLNRLLEKLYTLEVQFESLKKTSAVNNPALLSLKSEIDQIKPSLLENIHNLKTSLLTGSENLTSANNSYSSILKKIPKQEKDLLDFSRRQAIKSSVYTFLLQKREETALTYSAAIADNRIIDAAEASLIPTTPNKYLVYILAIIFGILLSGTIITIKDLVNTKIMFRSEIENFTSVPIVGELIKVANKHPLVVNNEPFSLISEQFRQIRAAIGLHGRTNGKLKLLVTSSISGEGKSFVSANLALSLALAGKKIVLVDMDLRNPNVSSIFNLEASEGVAEYLDGRAEIIDIVKKTRHNHLFVVPAGNKFISPTELLLNGKLDVFFNGLSEMFDCIIIDTAPIDPVTDAYILSQYCNPILFVIRHDFTPKSTVHLLDESNKLQALKNAGIVFNAVKSRGFFKRGYGFGLGYGYQKIYRSVSRRKHKNVL